MRQKVLNRVEKGTVERFPKTEWGVALQGLVHDPGLTGCLLPCSDRSTSQAFLKFTFKSAAYQYSVLLFGLGLVPHIFSKCMATALLPLRASGMCMLNYLDDWLILAHSLQVFVSHVDTLLGHLVARAVREHAKKHPRTESVCNISGNMFRLKRAELAFISNAEPSSSLRCTFLGGAVMYAWRLFRGF